MITVHVGVRFVVSVPPWHWGRATEIANRHPSVAKQICSIGLNDGGRWSEFKALRSGNDDFWATVTPASDLMTPIWKGRLTVTGP